MCRCKYADNYVLSVLSQEHAFLDYLYIRSGSFTILIIITPNNSLISQRLWSLYILCFNSGRDLTNFIINVYSSEHFYSGNYSATSTNDIVAVNQTKLHLCHLQENFTSSQSTCHQSLNDESGSWSVLIWFVVGEVCSGVAMPIVTVLGLTYVDRHTPVDKLPLYIGMFRVTAYL